MATKGQVKRVNIPRSVKDPHYRYSMPAIESKVEGSGNGIKTKIPNLLDIAKDLHREAADILKMFGFELGAVTIKNDEANSYIVNGKFSANELAEVLDTFIDKFVLCGSCRNPETFIVPSKGQVKLRCISCGNETLCDAKNKLTDFILKDAQRRKLKAKQEAAGAAGAGGKKKGGKSKKTGAAGEADEGEDDNTEWSVDVSSAAVKARRKVALGSAAESTEAVPKAATGNPEEEFKKYMAESGAVDPERLRQLRDALRLSPGELAQRVCTHLFTENIMKEIIPASARWAPFFAENRKAQDELCAVVVELALTKEDKLLSSLATIFKGLYDKDFVGEASFLQWYDSVDETDQRLLKAKLKLAPFASWLREAESDSEE